MKMTQNTECSIEELAAEVVRLGRELERAAHAVCLGGNSRDVGYASRTLRRLAERDPFDAGNKASIEAIAGIIQADLRSEVRGVERRFFETYYDDLGQHGEVRECPIYSDRGEKLLALQNIFARFMESRAATLDRVAAERAVMRLLSM
ncbi:hypothetical protein [Citreimonas salinaria]|uniref:Uncharacterized protein n=1 Tax=Citreimonas salinaria TaxID=321339 RepID=A0A1H3JD00_9RHOB|nr:hypothetical protein [Citreimonas salinaria]SDY37278.1 hypothetical protein SAMN05444340_106184 [Citreimonas salinaria]